MIECMFPSPGCVKPRTGCAFWSKYPLVLMQSSVESQIFCPFMNAAPFFKSTAAVFYSVIKKVFKVDRLVMFIPTILNVMLQKSRAVIVVTKLFLLSPS